MILVHFDGLLLAMCLAVGACWLLFLLFAQGGVPCIRKFDAEIISSCSCSSCQFDFLPRLSIRFWLAWGMTLLCFFFVTVEAVSSKSVFVFFRSETSASGVIRFLSGRSTNGYGLCCWVLCSYCCHLCRKVLIFQVLIVLCCWCTIFPTEYCLQFLQTRRLEKSEWRCPGRFILWWLSASSDSL